MDEQTLMEREARRRAFRPPDLRVLFIAESPPASGTFFYQADANLFRYTRRAFAAAFGERVADGEAFLRQFQAWGCYLIDLCLAPVNKLAAAERNRCRRESVPSLATRLDQDRPQAIVILMRAIEPYVRRAIREAGLERVPTTVVTFPSMGNHPRYISELAPLLRELRDQDILQIAF